MVNIANGRETGAGTRIWILRPVQIAIWFVGEQVAVERPEVGR